MGIFNRPEGDHKTAILISGRGSNMEAILLNARKRKLNTKVVLVFSDKKDAKGLGVARKYGIKTTSFSPKEFPTFEEYETRLVQVLKEHKVDLIVCAGYMRILKKTMIDAFKGKIINIHPSLLPSFPGLKAQQQAIDYGVQFSGCTVHFVDSGVDTGPIILQSVVPVKPDDTTDSLSRRILQAEHQAYTKAINLVISGKAKMERG